MQTLVNQTGGALIKSYMRAALDVDVVQHGSLPQGAVIMAANHPTTTDPFYMLSLAKGPLYLLVTEMAFADPVLGKMLTASGHIKVESANGRAAFNEAIARLKAGSSIGIFPEGTLSPREGGLAQPRTGTVRLALEANVPVIPIGIALDRSRINYVDMTRGDMSETARWYLRGPYAITVGEAMHFTGDINDHAHVRALSAELNSRIAQLAAEGAARIAAARKISVPAAQTGTFARVSMPGSTK